MAHLILDETICCECGRVFDERCDEVDEWAKTSAGDVCPACASSSRNPGWTPQDLALPFDYAA